MADHTITINATPIARAFLTQWAVDARRKMERHTLDSLVETARSIAAAAIWPVTAESALDVADHARYARRHWRAAMAYERVVKACDAGLEKLATEAP